MEYQIKYINGQIYMCSGRKRELLAAWLKRNIDNQTVLADKIGIDRAAINRICTGKTTISHTKFMRILAGMGIKITTD